MSRKKLDIEDIKDIISAINNIMAENKEYLVKLDAVMGDGDLGLSMSKGFSAVNSMISEYSGNDIGEALFKAGITMNNTASSTMGTLIATGMMQAGKEVKGCEVLDSGKVADMLDVAVEGVMQRGKAKQGEKTLLDSLIPAVQGLKNALSEGKSLKEAFLEAYRTSKEGVKACTEMVAQHGRARYYGEESRGKQDPGATAVMLIFKAISEKV